MIQTHQIKLESRLTHAQSQLRRRHMFDGVSLVQHHKIVRKKKPIHRAGFFDLDLIGGT